MNAILQNGLTTIHTIFKESKFSLEYNGYIIYVVNKYDVSLLTTQDQ